MSSRGRVRIAVVGVGAAGLATSLALSERLGDSFDLTLFDPSFRRRQETARGYPYQVDDAEPLLNAPARMMSVRPGDSEHFERWAQQHAHSIEVLSGYVTRPTYGAYLHDSFAELQQLWNDREGLLHCVPEEALDLTSMSSGKYSLATDGGRYLNYDYVVLCLGWSADTRDREHRAAYPLEAAINEASSSDHVGIIGTGLTSVDVIRALLTSGFTGKITAASRRGLLPSARNENVSITPEIYTRRALADKDRLTVRDAIGLVLTEASYQGISLSEPFQFAQGPRHQSQYVDYLDSSLVEPWSDLFVKLCDEVACDSWNLFDATSRRAFRRTLHPRFQAWCNPMPPATAVLIRDAIASGQVEIRAGLADVVAGEFRYANGDSGQPTTVIDASRRSGDPIASVTTALTSSLIRSGRAVSDAFGGVQVNYGSWDVLGADGERQGVYAVGSLTQGARYYVSALDSIVRAVEEVVDHLSSRIAAGTVAAAQSGRRS